MSKDLKKNNWKTTSEKTVYENPWIGISHREVINPSGNPGIYGVVQFKNIAVGVVPIDEDGNTYLVGQYRYTLNDYSWEIPEGGSPKSTAPLDTAKRELKEETGLVADEWKELLEIHTSNSVTDEYGICYIAKQLRQEMAEPEDTEDLQIRKLPIGEAIDMVMDGRITDSMSIACLLKISVLKQRGEL